jgi:hypothetical protein
MSVCQTCNALNLTFANDISDMLESRNDLPGTNITLHQMFIIVGGVCMGLSVIITIINLCAHFIWRTNLNEQKQ